MITRYLLLLLTVLPAQSAAADSETLLRDPWQQQYGGEDAGGQHVIALWSFDGQEAVADASRKGHDAKLEGAEIDPRGRFGACLHSHPGWPIGDQRHRALVKNDPSLSPKGPFTIELWIKPDADFKDYPEAFLIDKKYVADTDYQLIIGRASRSGTRRLQATLGFGDTSNSWYSEPMNIEIGTWYHVAFVYDGAGTGEFFVNGRLRGRETASGLGSVRAGRHPLSIGDRIGSYYHGFPGYIDQVRICKGAREFRRARFDAISDRTCFGRMEKDVALKFRLTNLDRQPLAKAQLTWSLDGQDSKPVTIADLAPGGSQDITYSLDTRLRPDAYRLQAVLSIQGDPTETIRDSFAVRLVARQPPDQLPVVMWGAGPKELERLKEIGFTHALGIGCDYAKIWQAKEPVDAGSDEQITATRKALDLALGEGITFAASLSPGSYLRNNDHFLRVDRAGKPVTSRRDICGLIPEIRPFCYRVGASVARTYGDLPAFGAALLHTEVRDAARPCFHPHDLAALRQDTGLAMPSEVVGRSGVSYQKLADFPADRVIPDDHPLYVYYRWYWKQGDGWNALNSELNRGLKQVHRDDFWTWHDPAVRVASVYGSGGDVDVISQWTYSYPDPIRIGVATDELLAMARGAASRQRVMKMTQIIWYRSQTAPQPKQSVPPPEYRAAWERQQPDAPFITIAPMHLREAFWTKIARPIKGIMYHGWQSLVPTDSPSGYRFTHPQTRHELHRLIQSVVRPLGPSLMRIPGIKSDVAFLESFASQMFAGRGTYGWSGKWGGDAYQVAMWAGLQPDIVFDETVVKEGLDRYKVLLLMDCDVLTASVADAIRKFQRRGGLIIGDDRLAPAIKPDIVLAPYSRTGRAQEDKTALQKMAAQLRGQLGDRYQRYVDTSNPDVVSFRRRYCTTDYIFLINDHRQYGRYVGQHGLVMEDGLPSKATVSIARPSGYVYDLLKHRPLEARQVADKLALDVELGPCQGRVLMVTSRPPAAVKIDAPQMVDRGGQATITITVAGPDGKRLNGVIPLEVTIESPDTRRAEFSGYWAARLGQAQITLDVATNDLPGCWTITARELASGRSASRFLIVNGEAQPKSARPVSADTANPVQPNG